MLDADILLFLIHFAALSDLSVMKRKEEDFLVYSGLWLIPITIAARFNSRAAFSVKS
jgi:hypothetical protein